MGKRYASLPISKQEGICLTWNLELRMAVNKERHNFRSLALILPDRLLCFVHSFTDQPDGSSSTACIASSGNKRNCQLQIERYRNHRSV